MTELDDHLRNEFAGVRERVAQLPLPALADRPSPRRRVSRPIATVVAFAVVVAIVVAAVSFTSSSTHEPTARTPTTLTPAPAGPPLVGFVTVPLDGDGHTVDVWSWTGRLVATVHTRADVAQCCGGVSLSPDGTRILVPGSTKSQVLDLHGRVLAQGDFEGEWADDSRHLCDLESPPGAHGFYTGPTRLVLADPGHGARVVAKVGAVGPHEGPVMFECSVARDEALVGDNFMAQTRGPLSIVRLDDGQVTLTTWIGGTQTVAAVSGSGQYALTGGLADGTAVIDVTTGRTVATVAGQPEAISWDGHLVVSTLATGDLIVTDWRTHRVLWRSGHQTHAPELFAGAAVHTRPHSDDIALDVGDVVGLRLGTGALWLFTANASPRRIGAEIAEGIG